MLPGLFAPHAKLCVLIADAGAPASAPDDRVLDTGTNAAAAAFVPSRPQPSVQSSNSISDMPRGPAAASLEGHADRQLKVKRVGAS